MGASQMRANPEKLQELEVCLAQIDTFAGEIGRAISAIAANAIDVLEDSVEQQQEQSPRLAASVVRALQIRDGEDTTVRPLRLRLSSAMQRLYGMNQQYAALLEHSGRSIRMLQALYDPAVVEASRSALQPSAAQTGCSWEG